MQRYWWVNQKQTYRHEVPGGYLWSPKRKSNDHRNPYYEFMREVAPGDIIFSYADTRIRAIGVSESNCYECPKPSEFGAAGMNWANVGWKIDVRFHELMQPIRPAEHMERLRGLLPEKYSPLRPNGYGLQNLYLTKLGPKLARAIRLLLGSEAEAIIEGSAVQDGFASSMESAAVGQTVWEEHLLEQVQRREIPETDKQALVLARRGQGRFKQEVRRLERRCRITKVERIEHLRASHCKPWRDSDDVERLDGENGLLLTPSVDHLFDRGFISFESNGSLLISPVAHTESLRRMGIPIGASLNVGGFSSGQKRYLEFHRDRVFLAAQIG